jgi:hypothetical protein
VVGDGATTFFWLDRWLPDGRLKDLAPHLFALIPRRLSRSRLVKDCLDGGWLDNVPTNVDALAIKELLVVADRVEGLTITVGVSDVFRWNWGAKATYSAKFCYLGMFNGSVAMARALQVWKSRAPAKCRFFLCWRCGTVARRRIGLRDMDSLRSSVAIHRPSTAWLCAGEDSVGHLPSLVGQRGSPSASRGIARRLASSLAWEGG